MKRSIGQDQIQLKFQEWDRLLIVNPAKLNNVVGKSSVLSLWSLRAGERKVFYLQYASSPLSLSRPQNVFFAWKKYLWESDRPFHNFWATRSGDRRNFCSSEILRFWSYWKWSVAKEVKRSRDGVATPSTRPLLFRDFNCDKTRISLCVSSEISPNLFEGCNMLPKPGSRRTFPNCRSSKSVD